VRLSCMKTNAAAVESKYNSIWITASRAFGESRMKKEFHESKKKREFPRSGSTSAQGIITAFDAKGGRPMPCNRRPTSMQICINNEIQNRNDIG
jgi:hypothetical protein